MKKDKNHGISKTFLASSQPLLLVLIIGAVLLRIFYAGVFSNNQMFYSADQYPGFLVGQKFWFEIFDRFKTFPWWNPYVDFGTSFIYNPMRGTFYPLNYLQLFVSPMTYFRWNWYLHLLILAWAFFSWGKVKNVSPLLLFTLTMLFITSPFINVFSVTCLVYLHAVTWTAWVFTELEKRNVNQFSLIRFILYWCLLISVGEPFCAFLSGVATLVILYKDKEWKGLIAFFSTCAIVGLLVFGHAFVMLPYSIRQSGLGEGVTLSFSMHPYRLVTLFSPLFFGHPFLKNFDPDSVTNDSPYTPRFFFDTLYFCLPFILLACMGIREAYHKKKWPLLGLLAFGLSLSFGRWGLMAIVAKIPPFSFLRYPEKMIWVTSILFGGFALKDFSSEKTHELKKDKLVLTLVALGCVLPLFAKTPEYLIALFSLLIGAAIFLVAETELLIYCFLILGLLQNFIAFPTQRVAPADRENLISKSATTILQKIPEGSLNRIEITPSFFSDGYPHENLLWGSNMNYRRASLFSYESVNTPFNEEIKTLIYGDNYQDSMTAREKPQDPKTINDAVQLTNLHVIAAKADQPMTSLLPSVESQQAVFGVEKGENNTIFLIPKSTPSPVWYFAKLERWQKGMQRLNWPPKVDTEKPFMGGVQRKKSDFAIEECQTNLMPEKIKPDSLYLVNENHMMLDVETNCSGWIFISQNLLPGWRGYEDGKEIPLYFMNEALLSVNVQKGKHHLEFKFEPWTALFKTFIPFL